VLTTATDSTNSNSFSGLAAGTYTVVAVDNASGCPTLPLTLNITEVPDLPTAVFIPIGSGSNNNGVCDPTLVSSAGFNGRIEATPNDLPTAFTFAWYAGADTTGTLLTPTVGTQGIDGSEIFLDSIEGGTYTLLLRNITTQCASLTQFSISDNPTLPSIPNDPLGVDAVDTVHVTICEGPGYPNGRVDLDPNELLPDGGDFDITWFWGNSVDSSRVITDGDNIGFLKNGAGNETAENIDLSSPDTLRNVDPGFYTVRLIDRNTGCISDPVVIEIEDQSTPVIFDITVDQDNYTCDVANPTGQITVDNLAGDGTSGFKFEWYNGSSAVGAPFFTLDDGSTTSTQSMLDNGAYTVRITDNETNCFTDQTVNVIESIPQVNFTLDQTDQTECNPPNGTAFVFGGTPSVTYTNGTPIGYTEDFIYQWYAGQDTSGTKITTEPTATSATLENQPAGYYTLYVFDNASGCSASLETVEIIDGVTANTPTIEISIDRIPSDCDALTGEISASITANPVPGTSFTFEWYEGSDDFTDASNSPTNVLIDVLQDHPAHDVDTLVTPGAGITATASLRLIPSGLYTVVAVDGTTGCRYQQTIDLPFNGINATTTLAVEHVTECPDNGAANVALADNINLTHDDLGAGPYFEIGEIVTSASGSGYLSFSDSTTDMQIAIISGSFIDGQNITGTVSGTVATTVDVDESTVDSRSGQDDIASYLVFLYADGGVPADRFTAYPKVNTEGQTLFFPYVFNPVTGELNDGNGDPVAGHTIQAKAGADTATFIGLPPGDYTAIAQEIAAFNASQCWTLSATDTIFQKTFDPVIDSVSITNNSICDPALVGGDYNGQIYVLADTVIGDSTTVGLNFYWYIGTDATGTEEYLDTDLTSPFESTFGDQDTLAPGDYTVVVEAISKFTDPAGNSCTSDTLTFTVGDAPTSHILADVSDVATDVFDCDPQEVGAIIITSDDLSNGLAVDTARTTGYTFEFYDAAVLPRTQILIGGGIGGTDSTRTGLPPGDYLVIAKHIASGCATDTLAVEIELITTDPTIDLTVATIDTSCPLGTDEGLGEITFTIPNPDVTSEYFYQWYVGNDTTGTKVNDGGIVTNAAGTFPMGGPYTATMSNLDGGTYSIRVVDVTNPNNACSIAGTIVLGENTADLSVNVAAGDAIVNANTACSGTPTGYIKIDTIQEDGAAFAMSTNYSISWSVAAQAAGTVDTRDFANDSIHSLPAGTYRALITNLTTSCILDSAEFIVGEEFLDPIIQVETITADRFCDPANLEGNGTVTISLTEPTDANFTVTWFRGDDISIAANNITAAGGSAGSAEGDISAGGFIIDSLSAGVYTVLVTDTDDPYNTCFTTTEIIVPADSVDLSITADD
ncbi:MAG: hypothetical protein RIF33_05625, partial [Cyclobacteriaceae bacterium]